MPKLQTTLDFEFAQELTPLDIINALDVGEESAAAFLDGSVTFMNDELRELASYKGVPVEQLTKI